MRRALAAMAAFSALAALAGARAPDGRLDVILTPNNGVPALVKPGQTFDAVLTAKCPLRLQGPEQAYALEVTWEALPGGLHRAQCAARQDVPVGVYALAAEGESRTDTNQRAVYVFSAFPDEYGFAHLSDLHIGSNRHPRPSEVILADMVEVVNEAAPTFTIITGDVTEGGETSQYQTLLPLLDRFAMPTLVCPGNHDRDADSYEQYFGPLWYAFEFGADGYLMFDTKDFLIAEEGTEQDANLYLLRRAIRPSRWSVGATHRYDPGMGMRAQLTLFVDDPLDYILYGHWHRGTEGNDKLVHWGTTRIIHSAACIDGKWRMVLVNRAGLHAQPIQQAVDVEVRPADDGN